MKPTVTLIGAGSRDFGPGTVTDLLLSDALAAYDLEVVLMDIDEDAVERTATYARSAARALGRSPVVRSTTTLDDALRGADFVITAIEVQRYHYWAQDFHIPRQLGFRQIYGENGGPGGLFHALRNTVPLIDIGRAMERVCPDAWLLNYTNPLTKVCEALGRLTSVKTVGLCHGVFAGVRQLARFLEMPAELIDARACGLNHFSWFQSIRDRETGEDLYPKLRERERAAHWLAEWDEVALSRILFRTFGLYPSPGTNHIGEYLGWADDLLASSRLQFFHDPAEGSPWSGGEAATWLYNLDDRPTEVPFYPEAGAHHPVLRPKPGPLDAPAASDLTQSRELAIPIIEGLACGVEHHLAAINVGNQGWIPNLPDGAVVEVPAQVGSDGLHPERMLALPEGPAAMLRTQCSINALLVDAFRERSRGGLIQTVLLDPTTPSYGAAVRVVDELLRLQEGVLGRWE